MENSNKRKVLLGMSGGMDSSMAAVLLQQQGYEVIGATLLTYADDDLPGIQEAKELAANLNIDHHTINCQEAFKEEVINYFINDYLEGRTPNPCIRCNETIKWKYLLELAEQLQCDHISTGHYVKKCTENNIHYIAKGSDPSKDQSYFLWNLSQEVLNRAIFPLGELRKAEVRELARSLGYHHFADKKESMGVCFLSGTNYKDFLVNTLELNHPALQDGIVMDENKQKVSTHLGYPYYTLGQKKGIENLQKNHCVIAIQPESNQLLTGHRDQLLDDQVTLHLYLLTPERSLWEERPVFIRVRGIDSVPGYNGSVTLCDDQLLVRFETPVWGMMPGQSIVFYQDDKVIGGGVVDELPSQLKISGKLAQKPDA